MFEQTFSTKNFHKNCRPNTFDHRCSCKHVRPTMFDQECSSKHARPQMACEGDEREVALLVVQRRVVEHSLSSLRGWVQRHVSLMVGRASNVPGRAAAGGWDRLHASSSTCGLVQDNVRVVVAGPAARHVEHLRPACGGDSSWGPLVFSSSRCFVFRFCSFCFRFLCLLLLFFVARFLVSFLLIGLFFFFALVSSVIISFRFVGNGCPVRVQPALHARFPGYLGHDIVVIVASFRDAHNVSREESSSKHFRQTVFDRKCVTKHFRPRMFEQKSSTENVRQNIFDHECSSNNSRPKPSDQNCQTKMFDQTCSTTNVRANIFDQQFPTKIFRTKSCNQTIRSQLVEQTFSANRFRPKILEQNVRPNVRPTQIFEEANIFDQQISTDDFRPDIHEQKRPTTNVRANIFEQQVRT